MRDADDQAIVFLNMDTLAFHWKEGLISRLKMKNRRLAVPTHLLEDGFSVLNKEFIDGAWIEFSIIAKGSFKIGIGSDNLIIWVENQAQDVLACYEEIANDCDILPD